MDPLGPRRLLDRYRQSDLWNLNRLWDLPILLDPLYRQHHRHLLDPSDPCRLLDLRVPLDLCRQ